MNPWRATKKFINVLLWIFFHIKLEEGKYPQHEQRKKEYQTGIFKAKDKNRKRGK